MWKEDPRTLDLPRQASGLMQGLTRRPSMTPRLCQMLNEQEPGAVMGTERRS